MVLQVGNSRLAIGVFVAGELEYTTRVAHADRADWPGKIAEAWRRIEALEGAAVAGSSVNPGVMESLELVVEQVAKKKVEWVGRDLNLPINVLTDEPKETGVDRVLNIAAAYEQLGKACVVVDAGTAVTVDVCNENGDFLGGAIAPGAALQLRSLHDHTAKLPTVQFESPAGPLGTSTRQAMLLGVYAGIRGLVKELAEEYATKLGNWPEIIATGGDAAALFDGWELVHAISPDLTLYGIALAYTEHYIKNES